VIADIRNGKYTSQDQSNLKEAQNKTMLLFADLAEHFQTSENPRLQELEDVIWDLSGEDQIKTYEYYKIVKVLI
jgi:hypothetical protein